MAAGGLCRGAKCVYKQNLVFSFPPSPTATFEEPAFRRKATVLCEHVLPLHSTGSF